jgi:serine/threonine protein kinase
MNKRKIFKKVLIVLLILFLALQFIPTNRNQSTEILASDFIKVYNPPTNIAQKLKVSCYDCHSNNSHYPWYNKIQPVAWFLENHINEAKEELNFSEFDNYSNRKKKGKLKAIKNEIKDDKMPLKSYTIMHKNAKFTKEEKKQFVKYFNKLRD